MVVYKCGRCGKEITLEDLEKGPGKVTCPNCSYKIVYKVRPPVIKRIKAI